MVNCIMIFLHFVEAQSKDTSLQTLSLICAEKYCSCPDQDGDAILNCVEDRAGPRLPNT